MKQVDQEKLDLAFARLLKLSLLREAQYRRTQNRRAQLLELKKLEQESKSYSPTPIGEPVSLDEDAEKEQENHSHLKPTRIPSEGWEPVSLNKDTTKFKTGGST